MKHLFTILAAILLASCASTRYASTYDESRDSTRVSTHQLNSIFARLMQRDSIYVREKGDTVTKYVEKTLYKWRTRSDTVYRDRLRVDTLYTERTDSVTVEKPVIEKQIKWYNQGFMWLGKMCCIALILWAIFLYLKRKF